MGRDRYNFGETILNIYNDIPINLSVRTASTIEDDFITHLPDMIHRCAPYHLLDFTKGIVFPL